jgi:hypothetical protein
MSVTPWRAAGDAVTRWGGGGGGPFDRALRFGGARRRCHADRFGRGAGRHGRRTALPVSPPISGGLDRKRARQFPPRRNTLVGARFANQFTEPAMQRQAIALRRIFGFLTHVSRKPVELPVAHSTLSPARQNSTISGAR